MNGNVEVKLDPSVEITSIRKPVDKSRPVVMASLGMHVDGLAMPHVDPNDTPTVMAGALFRFGRDIDQSGFPMRKFRRFVKRWLIKNMKPLDSNSDTSFETWIKGTPYSLKRKNELRMKYDKINDDHLGKLTKKMRKVKSFIKDETYETYKHARAINSRADEFKVTVGPILQLISNQLFALKWFIKKIPIKDRPQYIIDMVSRDGRPIFTSDYSSFEAVFKKKIKHAAEYQLYDYMTQYLPEHDAFMSEIQMTGEINEIMFKLFNMKIQAKKMSGEMDTSLSNGFSNLMFMLYMCHNNGNTNVAGCIEGDDGIFVFDGDPPTTAEFLKFGLIIKILIFNELNHASFCGMVFDLNDRTNVTDPIKELVSFGWTTARYSRSKQSVHNNLLRAKALSLAYQYPACPILSKLAYKVCQLTPGTNSLKFLNKQNTYAFNQYELEMMLEAHEYFRKNELISEPKIGTRLLVEQLYNVSVGTQIILEEYIDSLTEIKPLSHPLIYSSASNVWSDYFERYCSAQTIGRSCNSVMNCWPQAREPARFLTTSNRAKVP
jgi:hypothetical protein